MFQGGPNESVRNRVPLAYDPKTLDAILLTHAHLDHCGLIPHVVAEGFAGPIYATSATVELAELVLLDSGQAPGGVREAQGALGAAPPRQGGPSTTAKELEALPGRGELAEEGEAAGADAGDAGAATATIRCRRGDATARARRGHDRVEARPRRPRSPPTTRRFGAGTPGRRADPELALRYQPPAVELDLDEPLYTRTTPRAHWSSSGRSTTTRRSRSRRESRATFVDAGHILGSAIIRVRVDGGSGGEASATIVFSGDLGRPDTPIIRDPTVVTDADYVLVESTYGGREHEPQDEAIRILAETVRLVAEHDGVLLVPSFAIGRTQEVVWQLDRLLEGGEIPLLPLYLDSPMASKATDIYRHHPEAYDEETAKLLRDGDTPLDYPNQTDHARRPSRRRSPSATRPYMIVASNGMLTGGRVVGHLRDLVGDPDAVLLFVGYQGVGDAGRPPPAGREGSEDRRPDPRRCAARSARSAASRPTPTRASCSTGWATSPRASSPATPATRGRCSSSTAIRRPRSRSSRRSRRWASRRRIPHWREVVQLA